MSPDRKDIILIVGPVGSGKTELIEGLKTKLPGIFCWPTSTTTRQPRSEDAVKPYYRFVSRETFLECWKKGHFALGNQWVTDRQRGENYGTLGSDLYEFLKQLESGKTGLFAVVPDIAKLLKETYSSRVFVIFLLAEESDRRKWLYKAKERDEPLEKIEIGLQETRSWLDYVRNHQIADFYLQNPEGILEETVEKAIRLIKYHSKIA